MALPYGTTGSLCSSFLPVRLVGLPVKRACAITLYGRVPIGLSAPLEASVTLLEATTPVKLPTKQCPRFLRVRNQMREGQYFNVDSTITGVTDSLSPDYPTHRAPGPSAKLQ